MTGEGNKGVCEVARVCAADCVTRAHQALSGPQFLLWHGEWTRVPARAWHYSFHWLESLSPASSRPGRISG